MVGKTLQIYATEGRSNKKSMQGLPATICVYEIFVKCSQIPELHCKVVLSWYEHRCISKWGGMRRDPKPTNIPNERQGTCHSRSWWIAGALAQQIDWEYREQLAERKQEGDWGDHQVAPVNYDTVHPALSISHGDWVLVWSGPVMYCWNDIWFPCRVISNCRVYRLVRNLSCCCGLIWTIWISFSQMARG